MLDEGYRATVLGPSIGCSLGVHMGPQGTVECVSDGRTVVLQSAWNNEAVVSVSLYDRLMSFFTGQTAFEESRHQFQVRVPPLALECRRYDRRRLRYDEVLTRSVSRLLISLIPRCLVQKTAMRALSYFYPARKLIHNLVSTYLPYLIPYVDKYVLPTFITWPRAHLLTGLSVSCGLWVACAAFMDLVDARWRRVRPVLSVAPTRAYGDYRGPHYNTIDVVNTRLAVRQEVTEEVALDTLRRSLNEHRWPVTLTPADRKAWVETVLTSSGATTNLSPSVGRCVTCLLKVKTYRRECRLCKANRRSQLPLYIPVDVQVAYIGRVGLWSEVFAPPAFVLKEEALVVRYGKSQSLRTLNRLVRDTPPETTCRGFNAGPVFLGMRPRCFPLGEATSVTAFCIRLGSERKHEPDPDAWALMLRFMRPHVVPLAYESHAVFMEHFAGAKWQKMQDAYCEINMGYGPVPNPVCYMKGFTKAEKGYDIVYGGGLEFAVKPELKPRFICCPDPNFLYAVGRYTHPQLKWLSSTFGPRSHMFYAGCATPAQLNEWLNWTLHELPEAISYVDDIVAIDSNHNESSFDYFDVLLSMQYPSCLETELIRSERKVTIRVGSYLCTVSNVNASGVSDTSYKNGVVCLPARVLAIANAVAPLSAFPTGEDAVQHIYRVLSQIYTSAAGDDGLTRLPRVLLGTDMQSEAAMARYSSFWEQLGFSVKLTVVPEHRWRMATYLASRPVWAGHRYEWAPEPARRLRGMFWQIDSGMHPEAWARGVATQVLRQGRHLPVLSDICEWFLRNTKGPAIQSAHSNPHSPWNDYITSGVRNARAEAEFLVDYRITDGDLMRFRSLLSSTSETLISFNSFVIDRIFQEES